MIGAGTLYGALTTLLANGWRNSCTTATPFWDHEREEAWLNLAGGLVCLAFAAAFGLLAWRQNRRAAQLRLERRWKE